MVDEYVQYMLRRRRSPGTIRLRLFYLRKFQTWHGNLTTATHDDFETYIHSNPNWSENTQQAATASIRSFYSWATREGHFERNPARDLPAIIVHRRRQRIASEDAIQHAIECVNPGDRAMIFLGAECGLRVTEIATLHRDNREDDWLRIIGKGNKQRTLHMSPELCELLDLIETSSMRHGWYFPGRSGIRPIHSSTAWRHITAALESNPHSLRRRAGTVVYRNSGNDIRLAQLFLGHENITTTENYLDVQDTDLIRASALTRIAA